MCVLLCGYCCCVLTSTCFDLETYAPLVFAGNDMRDNPRLTLDLKMILYTSGTLRRIELNASCRDSRVLYWFHFNFHNQVCKESIYTTWRLHFEGSILKDCDLKQLIKVEEGHRHNETFRGANSDWQLCKLTYLLCP